VEPAAAGALFDHARRLSDERRWDEALEVYAELLRHFPAHESAWFNAGLLRKWRHEWPETLLCNLKAAELAKDPKGEPAWWNAGIAATALGDWAAARRAWTAYGLRLPEGEGPVEGDFGPAAIRLVKEGGEDEIVWARRIDPARARIQSVPLPASKHRWGDLVLNDGAPEGERRVGARTYRVFSELERMVPSEYATHTVTIEAPELEDVRALCEAFTDAKLAAEDWNRTVRQLCESCSRGRPHAHDFQAAFAGIAELGIAAPDRAEAQELLEVWARAGQHRAFSKLETVF